MASSTIEKEQPRQRTSGYGIAAWIASALLVGALFSPPYTYYTLLRWYVFAVSTFSVVASARTRRLGWAWTFATIAAVFNPFFPVSLQRAVWLPIDLAVAALFAISAQRLRIRGAHQC